MLKTNICAKKDLKEKFLKKMFSKKTKDSLNVKNIDKSSKMKNCIRLLETDDEETIDHGEKLKSLSAWSFG